METIIVKYKEAKGNHVCASQAIANNEVIVRFKGVPIDFSKTLQLGTKESFALQTDLDQYIYLDAPYRFFNHSCKPNCGLNPDLELVATRDITEGEELTYDYSTTMLEHHWQMECLCGTDKCRKLVGDFTLLPHALQKLYLRQNIVQAFIRRVVYAD